MNNEFSVLREEGLTFIAHSRRLCCTWLRADRRPGGPVRTSFHLHINALVEDEGFMPPFVFDIEQSKACIGPNHTACVSPALLRKCHKAVSRQRFRHRHLCWPCNAAAMPRYIRPAPASLTTAGPFLEGGEGNTERSEGILAGRAAQGGGGVWMP